MSLYKTKPEQKKKLNEIAAVMKSSGLDDAFVVKAVEVGSIYEGVFDLFELWAEEKDESEREAILGDIQKEIEEYRDQPSVPTLKRLPKGCK